MGKYFLFHLQVPSRALLGATIPSSDSFHTPAAEDMVKMSASLRAGTYDAGANLLRTCSLPDLTPLVEPAKDPGSLGWDVGERQDSPENGESTPGADSDLEPHDKDDVFYDDLEEGKGGEEGESEEEGKEDDEEEGEWSSSEDEDLQQLVKTLQHFVEEASEQ